MIKKKVNWIIPLKGTVVLLTLQWLNNKKVHSIRITYNGVDAMFLLKDNLSAMIYRISFNSSKKKLFSSVKLLKSYLDAEWLQNSKC